jgi:hypothetical protein
MRGLAEKIWKVLPPIRAAVSAAFSSDLAMEVCAPIRKLDSNNPNAPKLGFQCYRAKTYVAGFGSFEFARPWRR